jgi:small basic protein (TIGR04137 family)
MSIHRSLRSAGTLEGERSVFTRVERIAALKKQGKFDEAKTSIYGLPKVRTRFKVAGAKKAKVAKEGEAKPGVPGATAAAPAAAGAGGKPGAPAAAAPAKGGDKKKADKK